jgi:hypothetical protein
MMKKIKEHAHQHNRRQNPIESIKTPPQDRRNPLASGAGGRALKLGQLPIIPSEVLELAHATFIRPDRSARHTGRRPRSPCTAEHPIQHTRPRLPPTRGARNLQAVPERSLRAMLWI